MCTSTKAAARHSLRQKTSFLFSFDNHRLSSPPCACQLRQTTILSSTTQVELRICDADTSGRNPLVRRGEDFPHSPPALPLAGPLRPLPALSLGRRPLNSVLAPCPPCPARSLDRRRFRRRRHLRHLDHHHRHRHRPRRLDHRHCHRLRTLSRGRCRRNSIHKNTTERGVKTGGTVQG